jgi:poly(3-hydroxybutyrate) depolymerase
VPVETVQRIFMEHDLPRGLFTWRGEVVDPSVIRSTALLTVEGADDDMCTPGQTQAAHALCTGIPSENKHHLLQEGSGTTASSRARGGRATSIR